MLLKLLLLQIAAHLVSDFVLQPQRWSDKKESKVFTRFHIYHSIIVGISSYFFSCIFGFWKAALLIAFVHFVVDILKSWLILRNKTNKYFFIDQLIHLISIIGVVILYAHFFNVHFLIDFQLKTVAVFTGFIFCLKPSNILIKNLFTTFSIETPAENPDNPDASGLPNAGRLIGIVERSLALSLIIIGQYEAVGLIIAAKSILRINMAQKSEYILIGTLLSFTIAVFTGILINLIK